MTFLIDNEEVIVEAMGIRRDSPQLIVLVRTYNYLNEQDIARLANKMKRFANKLGVYQGWPVEGFIVCKSANPDEIKLANARQITVAGITKEALAIQSLSQ